MVNSTNQVTRLVEISIPMIRCSEFLLTLLQQAFQAHYPVIPSAKLLLRDGNLLFQCVVLFNKLALHMGKLLEIPFEESHLLLLRAVV